MQAGIQTVRQKSFQAFVVNLWVHDYVLLSILFALFYSFFCRILLGTWNIFKTNLKCSETLWNASKQTKCFGTLWKLLKYFQDRCKYFRTLRNVFQQIWMFRNKMKVSEHYENGTIETKVRMLRNTLKYFKTNVIGILYSVSKQIRMFRNKLKVPKHFEMFPKQM